VGRPDVRWTPGGPGGEAGGAREAASGYGGTGGPGGVGGVGSPGVAWETHVETLSRWCRSDWPLSASGREAASALALALGVRLGASGGGNGRGALGEVVRLVLAAAQSDVATLRAALADHRTPSARTLLANVVGAPWLLGVLRLRGATVLGTELRACTSREEAAAVLSALFGRGDETGGPLPALRVLAGGWVRGARRDVPLLGDLHGADVAEPVGADESIAIVLPLLSLDGAVPAEPPAAVMAAVLAGVTPRAPSPFLDANDVRAVGSVAIERHEVEDEDEDEDESDADAPDASADEDADTDDAQESADEDDDAKDVVVAPPAHVPRPALPYGRQPPAPPAEPEPMEADVMAAALARLRTRATVIDRVSASVASDDGVVEHVTDVVRWLTDATLVEVRALARDGWSGEEAIEVARALAEDDPEIQEVVRHVRRTDGELLVEIDGAAASAWLRAHRPDLARRLDDVLEDDEEEDGED
jgi:hypothetical protein